MTKIDMSKTYTTRGGRPVKLLMTDAGGCRHVIGAYQPEEGYWNPASWGGDGIYTTGEKGGLDLIEVEPVIVEYLTFYANGDIFSHQSRQEADEAAKGGNPVAIVRIVYKEGQFDE